ncbi:SusC/RagA family TonB-linked outer membrane protein [Ferruginibacter sp.]|nr:TonB-dependent receptor [Ferruginibacter sp.]
MKHSLLKMLILLLAVFLSSPGWAQTKKITGTITSADDGKLLTGVTVQVKGKGAAAQTDNNGVFTIEAASGDVLVFSSVSYLPFEITVGDASIIDVSLKPDTKKLGEVVVTGYGTQSRRTLTTSISKLDQKALQNIPYTNATQALQGGVSGVRVQTTSGQPGAASRVIVRGGTSINNPNGAEPLYIVDGIIRSQINDINPQDIESIQVLKDAASTAIYGARGSNGVVIVTSKKGKAGKMKITYNYSIQSAQLAKTYDLLQGEQFVKFARMGVAATGALSPNRLPQLDQAQSMGGGNNLTSATAYAVIYKTPANEYKLTQGWSEMDDPLMPGRKIIFKTTDWQEVLFRNSVTQNHYLGFSGGTDKGTYDLSLGYMKANGITIFTGYERKTAKLSGSLKVTNNFRINATTLIAKSNDNQVYGNNEIFVRALGLAPSVKYELEDGSLAPGQNRTQGNPKYHLDKVKAGNDNTKLSFAVEGDWRITKNLQFEPSVSIHYEDVSRTTFNQAILLGTSGATDASRDATGYNSRLYQEQFEGVFTYTKSLPKIGNFQVKGGGSWFKRQFNELSAAGRGGSSDNVQTLNASPTLVSIFSNNTQLRIAGFFGRVNYDWQKKYLLSATFRYDGASNLGSNNRWGIFPGVSVGWNAHEENFWKSMPKAISSFKLRGSYGVNGNLGGLGDFTAAGLYNVNNIYNGNGAIFNTQLANPNLQWEESKTLNGGFDLGLFDDKVNVILDVYNRRTDNLLTSLVLPSNSGISSVLTNLGSLRNKGFELEINANVLNKGNWNVNVAGNVSYNKNVIVKLPDNGIENNRIGGTRVYSQSAGKYIWVGGLQQGQQIGDMYAHQQLFVYSTNAQAATAPYDVYVSANPNNLTRKKFGGDVAFLDADKNDTIDSRDRVHVGNLYPKYTGGFSVNASYKSFSLTVRTDFTLGHTIYNETRARFIGQFQGNSAIFGEVAQSWQKDGDVTEVPRYYWADQLAQNNLFRTEASGAAYNTNLFQGNSRYYEKGDFLCLREVTLSYELPSTLINKAKISSLRVYVTGNNLHYFTKYKGLSPEETGIDGGSGAGSTGRYPNPRGVTLGVNIGL